jgi:hypothetical protein
LLDLLQQWARKRDRKIQINLDRLSDPEEGRRLNQEFRHLDIEHLNITKYLTDLQSDVILKTMLNSSEKSIVRIYIIDAFNLSSRDSGSPSDPYLCIKCNEKTVNERDQY